ncbi:hypothetical protein NMG60_11037247 [Bertholletia excelsa]
MNLFLSLILLLIPFILLLTRKRLPKNLPPGSLGLPIVGQSLSLLRAMRPNTAAAWLQDIERKYDPISKMSLFGKPTVFIYGQAANKLVFNADGDTITNQQTTSIKMILGERNLLELRGEDHKRVRRALVSFLKPECLKQYVGKIDKREELVKYFQAMIEGMWSVPINLPFTRYNRSLRASKAVQRLVRQLIEEKRVQLEQEGASSHQDLITSLLGICGKGIEKAMSEDEIVHNVMLVMVAGHDTSSVLITFLMRFLAKDPTVLAGVVQEQEERAKRKSSGDLLPWEDLAKMKYTWKAAMETLRMVPPVFGGFRKTLKDIEYGGYQIPEGWQWGACICPGYEFARIETLVSIHYLVTRFAWNLCSKDDKFSRNPMPVPTQELRIQIMPKKLV